MSNTRHVRIKKNDFKKLAAATPKQADEVLGALAEEGETIVKLSMEDSPASGRSYSRGNRVHVASSPGNPPRPDSGTLLNSILAQKIRLKHHRIVAQAEHAVWQEFGVEENGLEPRPFMGPMAMELERLIPEFFDKFLEDLT